MDSTLKFESHPDRWVRMWLFTDVHNSKDIRDKVVKGEIDPEFAFLNASLVPELFAVHLACCKALWADCTGTRRTKSIHAEVIVNISGSKHIGSSLTRFGIADDTKHLLVVRFDGLPENGDILRDLIKGKEVDISSLPSFVESEDLMKFYKISGQELTIGSRLDAICCRVAGHDLNK